MREAEPNLATSLPPSQSPTPAQALYITERDSDDTPSGKCPLVAQDLAAGTAGSKRLKALRFLMF